LVHFGLNVLASLRPSFSELSMGTGITSEGKSFVNISIAVLLIAELPGASISPVSTDASVTIGAALAARSLVERLGSTVRAALLAIVASSLTVASLAPSITAAVVASPAAASSTAAYSAAPPAASYDWPAVHARQWPVSRMVLPDLLAAVVVPVVKHLLTIIGNERRWERDDPATATGVLSAAV